MTKTNKTLHRIWRCFVLLGLFFMQEAYAEIPWYQVEVIVFEQPKVSNVVSTGLHKPKGPDVARAVSLQMENSDYEGNMVLVPDEQLMLTDLKKRLMTSAKRHVLLHAGWQQPADESGGIRGVRISTLGKSTLVSTDLSQHASYRPEIDGSVRVSGTRPLNVQLDLGYIFPRDQGGAISRLTEGRPVKNEEMHYFENSVFGVLIQVTQIGMFEGS